MSGAYETWDVIVVGGGSAALVSILEEVHK